MAKKAELKTRVNDVSVVGFLNAVADEQKRNDCFEILQLMQQPDIAIPILPSRSLNDTLAFYARLGFAGRILGAGDSYAILQRGSVELHFFLYPDLDPAELSFGCYIRVMDVESFRDAFAVTQLPGRGIPRMDALEDKPWGMREFAIVDPNGNLIRIGQTRVT